MKLRTASRLSVITLVVAVGAILYVTRATLASPRSVALVGTALGGVPAPDFQLADQHGATVRLSREQGAPVVLLFTSADCGDTCARTATALGQLGAAGAHVTVLAVSVDPAGDSTAAMAALSQQMDTRWHYLSGTCAALAQVWAAYGVAGSGCTPETSARTPQALGLFVIDARGHERVYLDSSFTADALATDLRIVSAK